MNKPKSLPKIDACPCCGGEPYYLGDAVLCTNPKCGMRTPQAIENPVEVWNRRPPKNETDLGLIKEMARNPEALAWAKEMARHPELARSIELNEKYGKLTFGQLLERLDQLETTIPKAASELVDVVESFVEIYQQCTIETGDCMCGSAMRDHDSGMHSGHSPVDRGQYIADQVNEAAKLALTKAKAVGILPKRSI